MDFKYFVNLFIILLAIKNVANLCIGESPNICLSDLTDEDAVEKLKYILNKYEEAEMKVVGEPLSVHGKRISYGSRSEYNIGFRYIDNTENDIIQYCEFILLYAPGECESISLVCNTFLPRTPRPLLKLKPILVCEDGVARINEQDELTVTRNPVDDNKEEMNSN